MSPPAPFGGAGASLGPGGRSPTAGRAERAARPEPRVPASRTALRVTQRLGFRLAALLAVALLPLGVISLLQADAWLGSAREQRAAALMGETLRVSAPTSGLVREAQGAAAALAQAIAPLLDDEPACDRAMDALKAVSPQYSVVAFVPLSGRMACAADGASYDYAGNPIFEHMVADGRAQILVNPRGPVAGASVVLVVHPLPDGHGGEAGYVALALPHAAIAHEPGAASPTPGVEAPDFVTFNGDGLVLTASVGLDRVESVLPAGVRLADHLGPSPTSFSARTASGEERIYAAVPLIPGELFAMGSVPAQDALALGPVPVVAPFLLAGLMWAGSLVVAWLAAEHLVTRYVRRLGRAIRAFASGSRVVGDLDMDGAPAEIREVGQSFLRMTDTILHDEAELEDTVHQREVLLREVHHRVKNNLQLIASIMNMQMRRARSPETKALMKGLQDRVMSLATVHRELYQTSGLADVRADELLGDLVRQIVGMASAPGRSFRIDTDLAPVRLAPDQAVPLSLLLTEALTNAIKYAAPAPGEAVPRIAIAFRESAPGRAALSVRNTAAEEGAEAAPAPGEGTGLGGQLVNAFASQLGGEVRTGRAGHDFLLGLDFALSPLVGAEARNAG